MALINFGPTPLPTALASGDPALDSLLLQQFKKKLGLGTQQRRAEALKMQSGTVPEGLAYLANSAIEGLVDRKETNAAIKAAMEQQQAAVDSANANMSGLPPSLGGAGGGARGGSGGGGGGRSASSGDGRAAVVNAMLQSPDTPASTLAAGGLSRTVSLPDETVGPAVTGPTAFGDPTAILQPGAAAANIATAPTMTLPPDVAGDPSARDSLVAAMLPKLEPTTTVTAQGWTPDDFDKTVRTVYGEAGNQNDVGKQAVAAVIANRAKSAGMSPTDVVLAKNQFEPWGNAEARARMENLSPDSPEYKQIAKTILPVINGQMADPTEGATHFYAPKAQAALGRNAPSWDDGTGTDIGDHRFFKLGYGGGGKDGRERVRMAALGPQATGTATDAVYGNPAVPSMPGDDPAKLRADAAYYGKTNPEAARQLTARADAAERGIPLTGASRVQTPAAPAPLQVAQAQAPTLGPGATMNDLMPNFEARRARIEQNLKSTSPWIREQAKQDAAELRKEFDEKQKMLFEDKQKRDISGFEQGGQNYRQGRDIEQKDRQFRHNVPDGTTVDMGNGQLVRVPTPEEREYDAYVKSVTGGQGAGAKPMTKSQWQAQIAADKEEATTMAKNRTEQLTKISGTAGDASANLATVKHLHTLMSNIDPGSKTAALEGLRAATGLNLDPNTDNVQAAKAIVAYMMPRMRVEGSGSSSDKDMAAFGNALPGLLNTPGANDIIVNTLGGLAQKQADRAEIAARAMRGEITTQQALKDISAADKADSFAAFKEWQKANPGTVPKDTPAPAPAQAKTDVPPAPAGIDPKTWAHMKPEHRKLFGGQ